MQRCIFEKMCDIKIFSTHNLQSNHIVLPSQYIIPIKVGFPNEPAFGNMIRDNTGNNISYKNVQYCELTTQYWAWKNVKADYYGFCHYRRFFSFCPNKLHFDSWGTVIIPRLTLEEWKLIGYGYEKDDIENCSRIKNVVTSHDVIITEESDLWINGVNSPYEHYKNHHNRYDLDCILGIINDIYPKYSNAAQKYIHGKIEYYCNMFIMNNEHFHKYCVWLFRILDEFEKRTDLTYRKDKGFRVVGYLGERLLGIYYTFLEDEGIYKLGKLQRVQFLNTSNGFQNKPIKFKKTKKWLEWLFPYKSLRRRLIKFIYYRVRNFV